MSTPTPRVAVAINVNGVATGHEVEARTLLAQYLREVVGLTGTNIGCDSTSCGACTVLLDGESVKSCTVLAEQRHRVVERVGPGVLERGGDHRSAPAITDEPATTAATMLW